MFNFMWMLLILFRKLIVTVPSLMKRNSFLFLLGEGILAFGEVDLVTDFEAGVTAIAQANGMGGLPSNTVVFGWPRRPERLAAELRIVRALDQLGKASMLIRPNPDAGPTT